MVGRAWWVVALAVALLACGAPPAAAPPAAPPTAASPAPARAGSPAPTPQAAVQPLSPPARVRYGTQESVAGIGLYLAQERGYFREEGLEVEFIRVAGGPESTPALASGDLDMSQGAPDPATFNAIARGIPIKFVTHLSLNRTDQVSSGLVVRQDLLDSGRVRGVADMKGMSITIGPAAGSTSEMFLVKVLERSGLSLADVQPLAMTFPDASLALINKAVDAAWMIQPFISNMESRGLATTLVPLTEVYPAAITNSLMIGPQFAERQPEAARRFVTAQIRGQRDFWHAFIKKDNVAARDEMIQVLTQYTPVKDPKQWSDSIMPGVGLNGELDDAILDDYQTYFLKVGAQHTRLDIQSVVDHSYVEHALARLGRASY